MVFDFYDRLKSVSRGYASFDYIMDGYEEGDLVRISILVNSDPVDALITRYLTTTHRDRADHGCAIAALGAEAVRDPQLRGGLADGTNALLDVLSDVIAASRPALTSPREAAAAVLAALTGGLVIARALADSPAQSDAALAARAAAL